MLVFILTIMYFMCYWVLIMVVTIYVLSVDFIFENVSNYFYARTTLYFVKDKLFDNLIKINVIIAMSFFLNFEIIIDN